MHYTFRRGAINPIFQHSTIPTAERSGAKFKSIAHCLIRFKGWSVGIREQLSHLSLGREVFLRNVMVYILLLFIYFSSLIYRHQKVSRLDKGVIPKVTFRYCPAILVSSDPAGRLTQLVRALRKSIEPRGKVSKDRWSEMLTAALILAVLALLMVLHTK